MKSTNLFSVILLLFVSSFFFVEKVNALFKVVTEPKVNTFILTDKGNYVVIHKQMDLNGEYTIIDSPNDEGEGTIGTEVELERRSYTGFKQPALQTIVIGFGTTEVTYLYEREKYTLTIQDEQYVTTDTPSGEYYYGQPILLVADDKDIHNTDFVKWSDGTTTKEKSFIMTEDVTIKPLYGEPYTISFETNGGSPASIPPIVRYPNEALGTLPEVTYDDCTGTEGSYTERGCTYVYEFKGWYKEPGFVNQVNESFIPTDDMTLYAKWNKIYFHDDQEVFTGNNMIDTEMQLFSQENAYKDFIVTFTLDELASGNADRNALFANMDERAQPYPGSMFRYKNANTWELVGNANDTNHKKTISINKNKFTVGDTFVLKREAGIVTYSTDGGETFTLLNDFTNFNKYFLYNATFGGEYDSSQNPYRYFKGTLSNMTIELKEPESYAIQFDANGGSGSMPSQPVFVNVQTALNANTFEREGYIFKNWNTEADGTGITYTDEQLVSGLAAAGESITLYAQWDDAPHYFVHFDMNGGDGTQMPNQEFIYSYSQALSPSTYTKEDKHFASWNTKADGTGTRYNDEQVVKNLSSTSNDVITLYAQYQKYAFNYNGEITFDGVDDYLDSGINLFDSENLGKDFDMYFTIVDIDRTVSNPGQATIMNAKDETHAAVNDRVPGFVTRLPVSDTNTVHFVSYWVDGVNKDYDVSSNYQPIEVHYKRRGGVITVEYTYDGITETKPVINQNNVALDTNSPLNVIFGAAQDSNQNYFRFFKGTIADIHMEVYE